MANLASRSATTAADTSFGANNLNITLPTGTVQNDGMTIVFATAVVAPTAAPTHTTPSGWSLGGTSTYTSLGGAVNNRVSLFHKLAGASEGTVNLVASANCALLAHRETYDNPDLTGWFHQVTFGTFTGTSNTATGFTTTRDNEMVFMSALGSGATDTWTPPSGMTERSDANATEVSDVIQASAGATGNKTATCNNSSSGAWVLAGFFSETLLAGSVGITVTPSGAMTGTGALAGSVALTVTPSGALTGAGALAGSIALSLAPTGTLQGLAEMSGAVDLTVGTTGTLTGDGALEGGITLTITPAGALTGAGELIGSIPLALSPAGALTGSGALSGTVALALDASGDLTSQDAGAITGSVALSLDASGALTGAGALAGSIGLDFGVNGIFVTPPDDDGFSDAWAKRHRKARQKKPNQQVELARMRDAETLALLAMLSF